MKNFFLATFVLMFLQVSFLVMAETAGNNPVAVSPGSETEAGIVWQSCPTFSWSAVNQAAAYRIAVFESVDANAMTYESMAAMGTPLISKDIPGPALSWTLSAEQRLKTGGRYAWYVQALDTYGNALGAWSGGRIFKVEQEVWFAGIEEKLGQKLKSYGVNEETITNVLADMQSEAQEVVGSKNTPGMSGVKGLEGATNTFYGQNAGASITSGSSNTFIGRSAGYTDSTGSYNNFLGSYSGYSNTSGTRNNFLGYYAGYYNTTGYDNIFLGHMAGTINATGYKNVFLGSFAGSSNNYGHDNIFLGYFSGYFNTEGANNIFLGSYAGYANTTGSGNIFFGYNAGKSNTTGYSNSFLGNSAGFSNTTGTCNVFLGTGAGYSSTANNNTFLGYYAGHDNTTGTNNTFIGRLSGCLVTTGYENTFLGTNTGYFNTTGFENTFIGCDAGHANDTGFYNVFLGYSAGYYNNSGQQNVFIGGLVGGANTTGSCNTFLGYQAGQSNVTGNYNTFLGYMAGYNETGSNKLYIANSNASFPLIYGEFDNGIVAVNGNLGIGIQAPIHPLHMSSGAYCSAGGTWTNASSRSLKENIQSLSTNEAMDALNKLNPVKYNYKVDKTDKHVGFIAEDVPDLVATADRKGLSSMDVTAVLTKVVQLQQDLIQEQQKVNREYKQIISDLQERMAKLEKIKH